MPIEKETKKIEVGSGDCMDCGTFLTNQNRVSEPQDNSMMSDYYCSRCYRHQLVFEMDWPERGTLFAKRVCAATLYNTARIPNVDMLTAIQKSKIPAKSIIGLLIFTKMHNTQFWFSLILKNLVSHGGQHW